MTNLYDINQHPNEVMTVDPVLYDALKKVSDANCREIYLGPLYASLENLCMSNDDAAAAQFDPEKDDDAAEEAAAVAAFAQNPDDISMEFPGETRSACMCRMRIRHMPQRWATRRISTFSG